MARQLVFYPDLPKHAQIVDLGGVSYRILTTWKARLRGWYLDISLTDGTGVARGVRITAGGVLVPDLNRWDITSEHGGVLVGDGRDVYVREDLGQAGGINVLYLTRAEWDNHIAALATDALDLRVTP